MAKSGNCDIDDFELLEATDLSQSIIQKYRVPNSNKMTNKLNQANQVNQINPTDIHNEPMKESETSKFHQKVEEPQKEKNQSEGQKKEIIEMKKADDLSDIIEVDDTETSDEEYNEEVALIQSLAHTQRLDVDCASKHALVSNVNIKNAAFDKYMNHSDASGSEDPHNWYGDDDDKSCFDNFLCYVVLPIMIMLGLFGLSVSSMFIYYGQFNPLQPMNQIKSVEKAGVLFTPFSLEKVSSQYGNFITGPGFTNINYDIGQDMGQSTEKTVDHSLWCYNVKNNAYRCYQLVNEKISWIEAASKATQHKLMGQDVHMPQLATLKGETPLEEQIILENITKMVLSNPHIFGKTVRCHEYNPYSKKYEHGCVLTSTEAWVSGAALNENGNRWAWYSRAGPLKPIITKNFDVNEPNNSLGQENCLAIKPNGKWNDERCTIAMPYIVEFHANFYT